MDAKLYHPKTLRFPRHLLLNPIYFLAKYTLLAWSI